MQRVPARAKPIGEDFKPLLLNQASLTSTALGSPAVLVVFSLLVG